MKDKRLGSHLTSLALIAWSGWLFAAYFVNMVIQVEGRLEKIRLLLESWLP